MFYLNEQTICPILTGIHIQNTLVMHINILYKICFSIFDGLCSNVTSAPFYLNLIHASNCQKNFPNVYKPYGVTVERKSCLIVLYSIFKVQIFAKVMDNVI